VEIQLDPGVLGPLTIPEAERDFPAAPDSIDAYRFSVYIPKSDVYYILSNQQVRRGMIRIDDMRPVRWIQLLPRPVSQNSKTYIAEGRHDVTLVFPRGELARLNDFRLRILPAIEESYTVNASQFSFIRPYKSFDYPTMYRGEFGMARREWGWLSFPVVLEKTGPYEISVTANNDRPAKNRVGFTFDNTNLYSFDFGKCDNSLETKTVKVNMPAGVHALSIRNQHYPGVDEVRKGPIADMRKVTFVSNFTVRWLKDVPDRRR
jgi:hypothetical protein